MSRHNKWSKIKNKKGATDAKRGAAFTKLARMLTVAAKEGGADPDMNFKLRLAIDAGRAVNMPKDTIERAIARATGSADGNAIVSQTYEAFGPGGVGLVIEAVTDNTNRTSGSIKSTLTKGGGNLGAPGSVTWQFERKGVIRIAGVADELTLIEAGAEDIVQEEGGTTIQTSPENFKSVLDALAVKKITAEYSGLEWVPKQTVPTDETISAAITKLVETLEDDDDVSAVFTNEA